MDAKIRLTYVDKDQQLITEPNEGDIGYCPETSQVCKYEDSQWKPIKTAGASNFKLTNYEINKMLVEQMPDEENIAEKAKMITAFLNKTAENYYMLLCRDINYYTVFRLDDTALNSFFDELITCCKGCGKIKSIELTSAEDAVEIWVQPQDQSPMVMYLFGYDAGVIECTR